MIGALLVRRAVRAGFGEIERKSLDRFLARWSDDAILEFPGRSTISGRFAGKDAVADWYRRWFDRMAEIRFSIRHIALSRPFAFDASNTVYVECHLEQVDHSSDRSSVDAVVVLRIDRGEVVHLRDHVYDQSVLERIWGVNGGDRVPASLSVAS